MPISAATATQSAFVPEGVWLSGKLDDSMFVGREDVYWRAPAGRNLRRSGDARPRYLNGSTTPAPGSETFPVTPLPPSVPPLEASYGVQSPLDRLIASLKDAIAIQNNAHSQDVVGFQSPLPQRSSQDRYYAGHHNDCAPAIPIPAMGPVYHLPAINVEFPPQHNAGDSEASTFSQSNTSLRSFPAQCAAPATHELWKLMPMELERSTALLYRPEDLWAAGPHHIDTSKPLPKAKTRGVLSRLRHKLLRTKF